LRWSRTERNGSVLMPTSVTRAVAGHGRPLRVTLLSDSSRVSA